jgi:hypothetical protein
LGKEEHHVARTYRTFSPQPLPAFMPLAHEAASITFPNYSFESPDIVFASPKRQRRGFHMSLGNAQGLRTHTSQR